MLCTYNYTKQSYVSTVKWTVNNVCLIDDNIRTSDGYQPVFKGDDRSHIFDIRPKPKFVV